MGLYQTIQKLLHSKESQTKQKDSLLNREDICKFNEMNIPKYVINLYNSNNNNNNSNNLTIRFFKWAENLNRHFF